MSLDFYLERVQPTTVYDGNYTHNATPMWKLAGVYDALYMSEGKTASEVMGELTEGYIKIMKNPDAFKRLNPSNGWGSYDTVIVFLKEVIDACREFPDAIIRISK